MQLCTFHVNAQNYLSYSYYNEIAIKNKRFTKYLLLTKRDVRFCCKKTLKKANKKLSPFSTLWLNLLFYAEQAIWFHKTMFKISVWGHVCRHSRIRTYHPVTIWVQWDVTSLSTDRHTASTVQHSHSLSALWIQKALISSTGYQMCSLSQLKTLWRTELTHRVEPRAGKICRGSSELYCSAPFTV